MSTLFCSKCFSDQCNAFPNCPTIASTQSINPTWIPKFYVSPNNFHKRGGEQTCTLNIHNFYRSTASDWTISLCQVSTFVIFPKPLQTVASGRRIWLQLVGWFCSYNWLVKELGLDILPYIGLILPHNSNRRIAIFLQTKQLSDPGHDGSSGRCLRSAAAGGDPGLEDLGGGGGRHRLRAAQEHCALW